MTRHPERSRHSPPIRRLFEVSRLEVQVVIAAYECVVPVIRRRLESHEETPPTRSPRWSPTGLGRRIGESHQ